MKKIFKRNARLLLGMQRMRCHGKRLKEKSPEAIPLSRQWEASGTKVRKDHLPHDQMQTGKGFGEVQPLGPRQEI